ncbi:glucose 1-dehydrogenase [Bauldia litoralis]|uniref:glucose 1-dehydrogenase n=1 Tax=Bauldia litoralis TaxID=665467 RepID=UPI003264F903
MQIDLSGKRVLVTGGNSGLGEAIVRAFAAEGARVAINYVTHPEAAQAIVDDIARAGGEAIAVEADISDPQAVETMFASVDKAWGGLDVLVNNAGIDAKGALSWEADVDAWRKVVEINLGGAFLCAREALKGMTARKAGVIINISSVHEVIAWSGYSDYAASKAGVSMMSKTLAQEAGPYGVRVLCIAPGAIATPINANVWKDPAGLKDLLTKIPIGRIGKPEDIAGMAVVLASDVAGYVTATTVFVDGGMTDFPEFMHGG